MSRLTVTRIALGDDPRRSCPSNFSFSGRAVKFSDGRDPVVSGNITVRRKVKDRLFPNFALCTPFTIFIEKKPQEGLLHRDWAFWYGTELEVGVVNRRQRDYLRFVDRPASTFAKPRLWIPCSEFGPSDERKAAVEEILDKTEEGAACFARFLRVIELFEGGKPTLSAAQQLSNGQRALELLAWQTKSLYSAVQVAALCPIAVEAAPIEDAVFANVHFQRALATSLPFWIERAYRDNFSLPPFVRNMLPRV